MTIAPHCVTATEDNGRKVFATGINPSFAQGALAPGKLRREESEKNSARRKMLRQKYFTIVFDEIQTII
jgi:hypothetical protein